jgi:hypothetical protein
VSAFSTVLKIEYKYASAFVTLPLLK